MIRNIVMLFLVCSIELFNITNIIYQLCLILRFDISVVKIFINPEAHLYNLVDKTRNKVNFLLKIEQCDNLIYN